MIKQPGSVVALSGGRAVIETEPIQHCEACASGRGCGAGLFARLLSCRATRLEVPNDLDVSTGDRVTVGVDERGLVRASLRLYGTFLMALVGGAAAGHALALSQGWPTDAVSVLVAATGVVLAMLLMRRRPVHVEARLVREP
jgi:sigma-E factor negative regulatory protein RseC